MMRSHYASEITPEMEGKEVAIAGWLHEIRDIGKIVFLQVRDKTGITQVVAKNGECTEEVMKSCVLPKDSVVLIKGKVKKSEAAKRGFEIALSSIENLNPLREQMPFDVTGMVPAEIDTRLNFRYVDLRRVPTTAIFNIESTILNTFRNTLVKSEFQEIRTPCIVGEATEGGAEIFPVVYFEKEAFLAQSPQLYKQLAVIGGLDKVFMVTPVFRAEKSNTVYHLTEITQMDIEMGFADHDDAISVLKKVVATVTKEVDKKNAADLEKLGVGKVEAKPVVISYKSALKKLDANGIHMEFGEDFNRESEAMLGKIFGDVLIVKEYPTMVRAFYSMPNSKDPEVCNSFDLLYKGMEICSGAQRIHKPELLVEALEKRGMNPSNFESYINAFKLAAPPHAGWSIGLERFAMKLCNAQNIRECSLFPRDRNRITP